MATEENKRTSNDESDGNKQETISELAHRHMLDENHTTSDEELRNAKLEFTDVPPGDEDDERMAEVDNTTVIPPIPGEEKLLPGNEKDEDKDIPNPYDVLGS
jgi:hypothetical protein